MFVSFHDILLANAEKTEQQDRPTAESLEAVRARGGFALGTPVAHGGPGIDTVGTVRLLAEIGRACPSTAWIAGTSATAKTFVHTVYGEAAPRGFFADPDAIACGSGTPGGVGERTPDGAVRVNGRWANVSGCEDASWAMLALMIDGVFHVAAFPLSELTVERTWQVAGMRGTGSQTLVAENVLVPADRVAAATPPPPALLAYYGLLALGPVVGATRGGLDVVRAMFASDRKPYMTSYTRMGESPGARQWLAEAALLTDRAERTMLAIARECDEGDVSQADQARLRADLADAAKDCRAAMELMLDLYGASGFATSSPMQRYWRDVAVASRHPHMRGYLAIENYGGALAG
ncbi:acyl-CoA dehydrogenase [Virgisporangium aliadipatigenens]|uniref:Acyl-CoA dehydrogenase n=1 Tax=Virgisporangium aliadipatigenens TaxID=741659 RepID=A0A8J3YK93_9ACTN|nr:acyl-CoA dehydrogenase family protein [Virgisporangium aliadipatigenens]GIJ46726.1 acyl-CoA dehydrogenase [Virgisporangium aliadipatigenens]